MLSQNIKKHLKKLSQKKYREEFAEFTVEGVKGIAEALQNNAEVKTLVVEQKFFEPERKGDDKDIKNLVQIAEERNICVEFASQKDVDEIKSTDTFPGILAVVKKPFLTIQDFDWQVPILCLDGVKDPGNVGTIIRTADWFGIKNILLSEDCVDFTNEKVVRSTMGSIFRLQVVQSKNFLTDLEGIKKQGFVVYGLTMNGKDLCEIKKQKKVAYIFGSESHGVRTEVQSLVNENYTIARIGKAESLNVGVAVGIVLRSVSF